jgi:putative DNA primase/helicase
MNNGNGHATTLLPHHRKHLQESGLSDETIERNRLYSEVNVSRIASLLHYKRNWSMKRGPVLVFPFFDELGIQVLTRVRPDNPPLQPGGKPRKYIQPIGQANRVYVPAGVHGVIGDPSIRLVIVEGEKKALKCTQEDIPAIGLTGCTSWHPAKAMTLLPDLERIAWKNRDVLICFDSDVATNQDVKREECLLGAALQARGARVRCVRIPPGPDDAKQGADDFLVAHGVTEFHRIINESVEPDAPDRDELKAPGSEMDAASEANRFLEKMRKDGHLRLRYWGEQFYYWQGGCYDARPDSDIRARTIESLNCSFFKLKRSHVGDVIDQLAAKSYLDSTVPQPTWIQSQADDWPTSEIVVFNNGILHLPSYVEGSEDAFRPATPRLFTTWALPFDFSPTAAFPEEWHKFLLSLWPEDHESIQLLQEWFGYVITPSLDQQKILVAIGPPRSGKGTIMRLQAELVGSHNTAGPTLAGLATQFGLEGLLNKSVAVIADARISSKADQAVVVERLLSISGQDLLSVDRKFKPAVSTTLGTRLVIVSNELPRVTDASGALLSRILLLQFTETFLGREDRKLFAKLRPELPGILAWAIQGWKRLRDRGAFLQPESAADMLDELGDLVSQVKAFVRDRCRVGPDHWILAPDLYTAWKKWCEETGRTSPGTVHKFGSDLRAAFPKVRRSLPRIDGKRVTKYEGIGLLPDFWD